MLFCSWRGRLYFTKMATVLASMWFSRTFPFPALPPAKKYSLCVLLWLLWLTEFGRAIIFPRLGHKRWQNVLTVLSRDLCFRALNHCMKLQRPFSRTGEFSWRASPHRERCLTHPDHFSPHILNFPFPGTRHVKGRKVSDNSSLLSLPERCQVGTTSWAQ